MRIIATLFAAVLIMAGCATPQIKGDLPIHMLTAQEVAGKTLTFSAHDKFEIRPANGGAMGFRDIGSPGKSGNGSWEIDDGKFWIRSKIYWTRGSTWTFYGPAADGSYRAVNARDSNRTLYRVDIH